MHSSLKSIVIVAAAAACSTPELAQREVASQRHAGATYTVRDTTIASTFDAAGVAQPVRQATLSTKLMGTVIDVLVKEGAAVDEGQTLARIDASDLVAKQAQAAASLADATAMQRDADVQARRIRALYADSAATRAHLDAVETAATRADAAVRVARAASAELDAVTSYATIRAPFGGIVSKRFVDPGAFAAPGAPIMTVIDPTTLRITANATPDIAARLSRGGTIDARIEARGVTGTIEGLVPTAAGNLYAINVLVPNTNRSSLAGSAATVRIPMGQRRGLTVPARAIVREGDLTGVVVRGESTDERRWVRLGASIGDVVEVLGGLRAGDVIVVPTSVSVAGRN